ncbi:MAG: LacI family transcriptional regulator [Lachnospiraceae bacterium]|nr:LacI family transcriptional regulator [Lachnospiraceae bacterium]
MVSIKDISAACGVSVATVSKALNDQKDIGAATKARIKAKALEMGYVPNSASRSLKTHHTYNLGVLYKDKADSGLAHGFYAQVLEGVKRKAESLGYDITFVNNSSYSGGRKLSFLEHCRYRNFDGVALVCVDFDDPQIRELIEADIPTVTLDYIFPGCSAVMSDNYGGIRELVKYAYEQGHRKIAYIHGEKSRVTDERVRGFKDICREMELNIPDDYIVGAAYRDTMSTHLRTEKLIRMPNPPTCILFPDDFAAIGGLNCIYRNGMTVPGSLSIAGFDGIEISRYLDPTLTTYVQNTERLGNEMADKLIAHIEYPSKTVVDVRTVSGYVFHGDSLKPI